MIVLTGDTQAGWAYDLYTAEGRPVGAELAASSVTAPSPFSPELVGERGRDLALLVNRDNEAVRYVSGQTLGYVELTLTQDEGVARYIAVDTVKAEEYRALEQARFPPDTGRGGVHHAVEAEGAGPAGAVPVPTAALRASSLPDPDSGSAVRRAYGRENLHSHES